MDVNSEKNDSKYKCEMQKAGMMVHMCLEREKINEQITILNYEENSIRLSLALNSEKPKLTPAAGACCI